MNVRQAALGVWEILRLSVPTLVDSARGAADDRVSDARTVAFAERVFAHVGMTVELRGREHLAPKESFIVMSNHQSLYDIPVLFYAFAGRTLRMVTKEELFRVPVWGQALRVSGFVPINRGNRKAAIASLKLAADALHRGVNIWISPEGTRSRTGKLGPFKKGGFHLALETGCRILPVTIVGTRDVLPAKSTEVKTGVHVVVTFSAPIDPEAYGEARRSELAGAVRDAIAQHLPPGLRGDDA